MLREIVLTRRGVVCLAPGEATSSPDLVDAVAIELAAIGYVPSTRLHARLMQCSPSELFAARDWICQALLAERGGDRKHVPLFRSFPEGIPTDTRAVWWKKVLVHFLQAEGQPCLFCGSVGTTHVLNPCRHVVCDRCFDGSSYSACPVCEHHVDPASLFFQPSEERGAPVERVIFNRLDLAESLDAEARALFVSLCERRQALSPGDRDALVAIVRERRGDVTSWLPAAIPVRENIALIFGTLIGECDAAPVMAEARRFLTTATDVLRLLAVASGTDGSLLPEVKYVERAKVDPKRTRFWDRIAKALGAPAPPPVVSQALIPMHVHRFRMARLPRRLRRELLAILESFDRDRLVEDMLRHRSYWVWAGEFLHPHEYAKRYPNVARAFQVVRGKGPDGTPAPQFTTWSARVEERMRSGRFSELMSILGERPGELGRRFDHALRLAGDDASSSDAVLAAFERKIGALATPMLLTLNAHLRLRDRRSAVRVYWPKGRVAMGPATQDRRATLRREAIDRAVRAIEEELLRRFAAKPAVETCIVDEALRSIMVPFNERTASPAAVALPRGSRIPVAREKNVRLFLHWCQPPRGKTTDLDLSVAFYDAGWRYLGVCSYYQLTFKPGDTVIARSAGDLQSAPWPNGATEFVDVDRNAAYRAGIRYAVMVVNNYAGLPFSRLERGFAGLMLRDDLLGAHFDPRTVELRFNVNGENGVFLPLVLDLEEGTLHWLDVQARGEFELNNVETSKNAIARLCPDLITYFASGTRASMYDLALMHAAARSRHVFVRDASIAEFTRRDGEDATAFLARLRNGAADARHDALPAPPELAFLYRGDVDLPDGASAYVLFREQVTPTLAASDLLSA